MASIWAGSGGDFYDCFYSLARAARLSQRPGAAIHVMVRRKNELFAQRYSSYEHIILNFHERIQKISI